jgi:hypothetical protein
MSQDVGKAENKSQDLTRAVFCCTSLRQKPSWLSDEAGQPGQQKILVLHWFALM